MRVDSFLKGLRPGGPCLVLLDFDGTLSAIRRHRDKAVLGALWRRLLRQLVDAPGMRVALVSGRGLKDLRGRTEVPGLLLVGNHGLHWSRPNWGPPKVRLRAWRAQMLRSRRPLSALLKRYPGADLEDKGLDLCVHLRGLGEARRRNLEAELRYEALRLGLLVSPGRASLELKPRAAWNKGVAVRRLRGHFHRNAPCFFAGDDVTDEQGFGALKNQLGCLTYKVGEHRTLADKQGSRRELFKLLNRILRTQTAKP